MKANNTPTTKYRGFGKVHEVKNKAKHFAANDSYLYLRVYRDGKAFDLLLTQFEFEASQKRAAKNTEDIPHRSLLRKFSDWMNS